MLLSKQFACMPLQQAKTTMIVSTKNSFPPQTRRRPLPYARIFFGTTNMIHVASPKKLNSVRQWPSPIFRPLKVIEGHPKGTKKT